MKSLVQMLNEALDGTQTLNSLEVKWDGPEDLFIQVPESYGESDIQIYLDDTLLSDMPIEADPKALGKNEKQVTDAYFEYEKMEASQGTSQKADIEWDEHYDQLMNGTNMNVMRIKGLKYCAMFDKFVLENAPEDEEEIRDILFSLFNGMAEDIKKDIPFELVLNKDNINWK